MAPFPRLPTRFLFAAIAVAALLGGCATSYEPVPGRDYFPPAPGPAPLASIAGSQVKDGSAFSDAHTGFVSMIDGLFVVGARDRWNQPVSLTPGNHDITAEYRFSNFLARASLKLAARAGTAYRLVIGHGTEPANGRAYCEFWIADTATGNPVTPVQRRPVSGGKTSSVFSAN
jgi:hypothetical protein